MIDSDDRINELLTEVESLKKQVAEKQKIIEYMCLDWAHDHTYVENIAKKLGIPQDRIEGDSYGVPGIIELVDMIVEKIPPSTLVWMKSDDNKKS